jgi:hypothetical protein
VCVAGGRLALAVTNEQWATLDPSEPYTMLVMTVSTVSPPLTCTFQFYFHRSDSPPPLPFSTPALPSPPPWLGSSPPGPKPPPRFAAYLPNRPPVFFIPPPSPPPIASPPPPRRPPNPRYPPLAETDSSCADCITGDDVSAITGASVASLFPPPRAALHSSTPLLTELKGH